MIIEAIFDAFLTLTRALLDAVLPTSSAPLPAPVTGFIHWYAWANTFLPLSDAIGDIVLVVEVLTGLAAIWLVTWVLQRAHIIGGAT